MTKKAPRGVSRNKGTRDHGHKIIGNKGTKGKKARSTGTKAVHLIFEGTGNNIIDQNTFREQRNKRIISLGTKKQ